jgi:hypothetical protein
LYKTACPVPIFSTSTHNASFRRVMIFTAERLAD